MRSAPAGPGMAAPTEPGLSRVLAIVEVTTGAASVSP